MPGALHAVERVAIGLLPLVATCDRWDMGGISTALHLDTEAPSVFVYYAGHPGGGGVRRAGVRDRGGVAADDPGRDRQVPVRGGVPVVRPVPEVRNGNNPLAKADAVKVLDVVLANLPRSQDR